MKKFYKDIEYIELSHERAKELCSLNPQFVMSRVDWAGYHFIKDNKYFILLKSGMCIYCGEVDDPDLEFKIYNYNDEDWIIGFRTDEARKVEEDATILDYFIYHKLLYEGQIEDSPHELLLDGESDKYNTQLEVDDNNERQENS